MMEYNTNQFKLENLRSAPSRPTIPYAQFPRPTLLDPEASFDGQRRSQSDEDDDEDDSDSDSDADATTASRGSFQSDSDAEMESGAGSQHRRRRSNYKTHPGSAPPKKPLVPQDGVPEEVSWSQDDEPWSDEESKSNSDNQELNNVSDDDDLQVDEEAALTGNARGKQRRRRRRNQHMDQRIVNDSEITKEEKKEADHNVLKSMLIDGLFIALW